MQFLSCAWFEGVVLFFVTIIRLLLRVLGQTFLVVLLHRWSEFG